MVQLRELKKKGIESSEEVLQMGFEGKPAVDPQNEEFYFKLYLNGEYVGDTELNETNGDIEIVCYNKVSYDKVMEIVGERVTVWAWFDNVFTNNN